MKNNKVILKVFRKSTVKRVKDKLRKANMSSKIDALEFLNIRLISTIAIFFIILILNNNGFIIAPIVALIYFILFEIVLLDYRISKRSRKLENEAIYFLEVLSLTIESGRNLKSALQTTCQNVNCELSDEFKKTLEEVELGKSLSEALENMKKRIPSDSINSTILKIRESNMLGVSVLESLYQQIDYLRDQQILDVKAKISKLPTKISIISVLLFLPLILLIILSPIVIQYILG